MKENRNSRKRCGLCDGSGTIETGTCPECDGDGWVWALPEPEIRNFTPHPINIIGIDGEEIATFQPEGLVRLQAVTETAGNHAGIPLSRTVFGKPEGLPEAEEGTLLIVSQIVKSALPDRLDLVVPAEVVRDKAGRIVGCRSLGL